MVRHVHGAGQQLIGSSSTRPAGPAGPAGRVGSHRLSLFRLCRLAASAGATLLAFGLGASAAQALKAHGQLLHLAPGARAQANQSTNWLGYVQGTLEQGGRLFSSIGGRWTVPTASEHTKGQDEYSSDWIGIGGGCVDAGCLLTDATLIQTGTEQDVSDTGKASYSAWWEVIPGPSLTITDMKVGAGDRMRASIAEVVTGSNLWTITIRDLTRRETYSITVPYSSTHDTAEWIEETPLLLGANAGFAALPKLSSPAFDLARTNGQAARLSRSEEMDLIDSGGKVIGAPSAPDSDADGFNACTWVGRCAAQGSS
jgi:hypothetical protein